ncbi:GDSL esterase/lipase At2g30310-like [Gastrolobium bilobum]|uniref:GDSL esterase/lipase At2g30310-like n=1 Tax=Gastrolobium bilobum TaxID=150636 RepID=UPI002AB2B13A|nr:GDSL esterase/lipase At2g30310-like [Gastrolobium bilobum]
MALSFQFIILMHVYTIVLAANSALAIRNYSSILVFGDSTVDTGNNNYIVTVAKGNRLPYGRDFPGHVPNGRFCNGKVVPDFVASILEIKDTLPPFLDPTLSDEELLTGVSFASGGSGFDDLTAAEIGVIPVSQQVEYFKTYVAKLKLIVGENEAKQILGNSLVIIAAGPNDVIINFYDLPTRRVVFNIDEYHDYLQDKLETIIKDLYDHGCLKIVVAGLPPVGCVPFQISLKHILFRECVENENSDSQRYNKKLIQRLLQIQAMLPGSTIAYADLYHISIDLVNQPEKYGFVITHEGCCGTGTFEATPLCNELTPVCDDASKYVFWDSYHPSEASNRYIAKYLETQVLPQLQL